MNRMESYIRDRHDDAHHRRCEAEAKLLAALDEGEDIAAQVAAVAQARAIAFWWDEPVTGIDHECLDPVEALWRARDTARRALTDHTIPRHADPFAQGFALAFIEAARTFHRDTAHLDALTTRHQRTSP
ncbi:hypothetical protein [Actinomadura chibensis]|uniref:Uncharacterized protein n=1 Tax=Actinomadura chibensis TaxID=392828 RepID=A0A5D0N908_9ACTN|nr:hypothetical protein [Actinomadura chibensis]TYB40801.1 hypothetical protein FXF69_37920 [Actinomadura chibensis]